MKKRTGFLVLLGLLSANLLVWAAPVTRKSSVFDQIDLLVDIRHEIVSEYVETPDENKMVQQAVRGMVDSLSDPFTVYMPPEEMAAFDKQIRGSFSGIGAEVDIHQNRLRIVSPLEGSPAWKAGVMAGDIVLEINGESTLNMKINDCIERLTGPEGTQVKIKIRHENGEETELTITRQKINVQTVKGARRGPDGKWDYMLDPDNKIGYIRLTQFTEPTVEEFRAAVKQLESAGAKGLIFDMRFNPGGLLEAAVAISNIFLEKGQRIVSVKGRAVPERVEVATVDGHFPSVPMVVLANEASASASEVVTGALTDNGRALFVGTRTFGKGSVQQVKLLDNNQGALKITNAYYYLPKGRNIHRREGSDTWGVDPSENCYVPMNTDQIRKMLQTRNESDVLRGNGGNGGAATKPAAVRVTPDMVENQMFDPQLAAGLRAVLGKIEKNEWPKVGLSGAQQIARQARHDNLVRQRDAMKQRLDEIEVEINKLDANAAATQPAATQPAGK